MTLNPITFNPGPSQLTPAMVGYIQELAASGYLSASHRSSTFMEVSKRAVEGLRQKMGIPPDYHILYQPSATAAMDTLLRNLVRRKSFHFTHGAFSGVFYKTAKEIGLHSECLESALNSPIDWQAAKITSDVELIAVTHNETSTGLMWPESAIRGLRTQYPHPLLAIDVTSTFGAMRMDWTLADVWFGSVQKCLGLPSGLGYILLGPRAYELAKSAKGVANWQSMVSLVEKMQTYETPETPNMFAIALLAKQMESWDLKGTEERLKAKARALYEAKLNWTPYITDKAWRSVTVPCFAVKNPDKWFGHAKKAAITLGKGYGGLKESTIRIATFPAITQADIERLLTVLSEL